MIVSIVFALALKLRKAGAETTQIQFHQSQSKQLQFRCILQNQHYLEGTLIGQLKV